MRSEMMQEQQPNRNLFALKSHLILITLIFTWVFDLVLFLFFLGHRAAAAQRLQTGTRGL